LFFFLGGHSLSQNFPWLFSVLQFTSPISFVNVRQIFFILFKLSLVASSPLCDSVLVEIKWINVLRNTTVFSICWRKQLHVSAHFWVGHHQVETRTSGKIHILQCGYQAWRTRSRFTMFGEERSYIYAMFTTLFVMSSVSSSTRRLESSLNVALESVVWSVLGWVVFISDWVFFRCVSWVVIQVMPRSKRL
jgi:hypothetical protein